MILRMRWRLTGARRQRRRRQVCWRPWTGWRRCWRALQSRKQVRRQSLSRPGPQALQTSGMDASKAAGLPLRRTVRVDVTHATNLLHGLEESGVLLGAMRAMLTELDMLAQGGGAGATQAGWEQVRARHDDLRRQLIDQQDRAGAHHARTAGGGCASAAGFRRNAAAGSRADGARDRGGCGQAGGVCRLRRRGAPGCPAAGCPAGCAAAPDPQCGRARGGGPRGSVRRQAKARRRLLP